MTSAFAMETDEPPQERWFAEAHSGDLAAFEKLLVLHQRQVYLTALRLLGCAEDAQDAAQEVLFRLYRHLRSIRSAAHVSPWLYRVTVNVCRDAARRRRREGAAVAVEPADRGPDPHAQFSRQEQRRILEAALRHLPEKQRTALVLRDIEGLSTAEVARILGSAEVTVRTSISRARQRLMELVERFQGGRK